MSRSLNAKIISLVIRSVSEFNLTVTKTPDPPEEYPTNWPTYWFVFIHQNTELNKLKLHGIFNVKSYHSFLLLFFGKFFSHFLDTLDLTPFIRSGHHLKPILSPSHRKMVNLQFVTSHFDHFDTIFHENRMIFHKLPAAKTKPFVYRPKDNKIR